MERKLEEIDEILSSYEDWMHGINGEQCTKARKLLSEVQQQLKILNIPVVTQQGELLMACLNKMNECGYNLDFEYDEETCNEIIKAINCG